MLEFGGFRKHEKIQHALKSGRIISLLFEGTIREKKKKKKKEKEKKKKTFAPPSQLPRPYPGVICFTFTPSGLVLKLKLKLTLSPVLLCTLENKYIQGNGPVYLFIS